MRLLRGGDRGEAAHVARRLEFPAPIAQGRARDVCSSSSGRRVEDAPSVDLTWSRAGQRDRAEHVARARARLIGHRAGWMGAAGSAIFSMSPTRRSCRRRLGEGCTDGCGSRATGIRPVDGLSRRRRKAAVRSSPRPCCRARPGLPGLGIRDQRPCVLPEPGAGRR